MEVWHDEPGPLVRQMRERRQKLVRLAIRSGLAVAGLLTVLHFLPPLHAETLTGRLQTIDGDTVWHYAPDEKLPEKIRLLDIDAPESFRSTCEVELIAGLRAKARLAELLQQKPVRIERCDEHGDRCEDRFGRTLARLHTPAGEVGTILMREGLAVKYEPGKKAERTSKWCGNG